MKDISEAVEGDNAPAAGSRSNRKLRLFILAAVIVAVLAGAWWYYRYVTYGQYMQSTDNAYVAADSVVVSSKVAGYVDAVLVSENQQVARGEALVQLDLRDYRAQAAQARAQIAATVAGADTIRSQVSEQNAAIRQARAQLAVARATLDLANKQVNRYRPLAASGAEPPRCLSRSSRPRHRPMLLARSSMLPTSMSLRPGWKRAGQGALVTCRSGSGSSSSPASGS